MRSPADYQIWSSRLPLKRLALVLIHGWKLLVTSISTQISCVHVAVGNWVLPYTPHICGGDAIRQDHRIRAKGRSGMLMKSRVLLSRFPSREQAREMQHLPQTASKVPPLMQAQVATLSMRGQSVRKTQRPLPSQQMGWLCCRRVPLTMKTRQASAFLGPTICNLSIHARCVASREAVHYQQFKCRIGRSQGAQWQWCLSQYPGVVTNIPSVRAFHPVNTFNVIE